MRRPARPNRRFCARAARRLLATIGFALGLFSLQLGQLSHSLFVKHAVCEHGELVHVTAATEGHAPGGKAAPGVVSRTTEAGLDAGTAQSQAHDHCDSNAVRARVAEIAPYVVLDRWLDAVCLAPDAERPEERPIAVLWLAPKSSPPCV